MKINPSSPAPAPKAPSPAPASDHAHAPAAAPAPARLSDFFKSGDQPPATSAMVAHSPPDMPGKAGMSAQQDADDGGRPSLPDGEPPKPLANWFRRWFQG